MPVRSADTEQGSVNEYALTRAISLIVSAISDRDVLSHCESDELRDCLALHLIDCLVIFLRGQESLLSLAIFG